MNNPRGSSVAVIIPVDNVVVDKVDFVSPNLSLKISAWVINKLRLQEALFVTDVAHEVKISSATLVVLAQGENEGGM